MEILLLVVIGIMIAGFAFVLYFMTQKLGELKNDQAVGLIKQDLVSMSQTFAQTQAHMNDRLDKAAQVFGGLQNELGKMQELGRSMKDIQDVLKSPKLRGNIGEQLMADLIKQQIPKGNFTLQYEFKSRFKVDAVIKTNNGLIPIDSKFPVENYLKYSQSDNDAERATAHKDFVSDIKKHVQAIAKKYILPDEGTVDFALMYVPGEAVFYEIMTNTDLDQFANSYRVYFVSPHTFSYYLGVVYLSLEGEVIQEKAKEVMNFLKGIQIDARKFGVEFDLVNKHLGNAKAQMDKAAASFGKLGGKIESANQLTGEKLKHIEAARPNFEAVKVGMFSEDEE